MMDISRSTPYPGASEQNKITFRSEVGNPQSGTISHRFTTFFFDYLLRLKNAEHVTLKNLRFLPLDTSLNGVSLYLVGKPRNITIEGSRFDNDEARTLPPRVTHIFSDEESVPENIVVQENRFNGGTRGVYFFNCFGFGCEDSTRMKGTEIIDNIFRVTDTARSIRTAITMSHQESPLIDGNDIETFGTAISLSGISGFLRVVNNRIDVRGSDFGGSSATGIIHSFPDRMEPFGLIANNMIKAHDPVFIPDRTSQLVGVNIGTGKEHLPLLQHHCCKG